MIRRIAGTVAAAAMLTGLAALSVTSTVTANADIVPECVRITEHDTGAVDRAGERIPATGTIEGVARVVGPDGSIVGADDHELSTDR